MSEDRQGLPNFPVGKFGIITSRLKEIVQVAIIFFIHFKFNIAKRGHYYIITPHKPHKNNPRYLVDR